MFSCCNSRDESLQQRMHGPQSWKYSLSRPLHKKFVDFLSKTTPYSSNNFSFLPKVVQAGFCHSPAKIIIKVVRKLVLSSVHSTHSSCAVLPWVKAFCHFLYLSDHFFLCRGYAILHFVFRDLRIILTSFFPFHLNILQTFGWVGAISHSSLVFPSPGKKHTLNGHTLYLESIFPPTIYIQWNFFAKRSCLSNTPWLC